MDRAGTSCDAVPPMRRGKTSRRPQPDRFLVLAIHRSRVCRGTMRTTAWLPGSASDHVLLVERKQGREPIEHRHAAPAFSTLERSADPYGCSGPHREFFWSGHVVWRGDHASAGGWILAV